jgi:hypothetical protein
LVSTVGAPRKKVFFYMFIFGIFWSILWTFSIDWLIDIGLINSK